MRGRACEILAYSQIEDWKRQNSWSPLASNKVSGAAYVISRMPSKVKMERRWIEDDEEFNRNPP